MTHNLLQVLPNGWTFSVAPDLSGTGFNVAAYPTPGSQMLDIWFRFKNGRFDVTVYSFDAALKLYQQVKRAKPPAVARQAQRKQQP